VPEAAIDGPPSNVVTNVEAIAMIASGPAPPLHAADLKVG
jgi:hypothetical protein